MIRAVYKYIGDYTVYQDGSNDTTFDPPSVPLDSTFKLEVSDFFTYWTPFRLSWTRIRIRIPNTDPDPGEPFQYGFKWIRIRNTGLVNKLTFSFHLLTGVQLYLRCLEEQVQSEGESWNKTLTHYFIALTLTSGLAWLFCQIVGNFTSAALRWKNGRTLVGCAPRTLTDGSSGTAGTGTPILMKDLPFKGQSHEMDQALVGMMKSCRTS